MMQRSCAAAHRHAHRSPLPPPLAVRNRFDFAFKSGHPKFFHRRYSVVTSATASTARGEVPSFDEAPKKQNELGKFVRIALPALGIVLADPLQTLVDSACVGRLSSSGPSSTLQLAALGPNTAIFNATFQILSFIGVATANLIAVNSLNVQGLDETTREERREKAGVAVVVGLSLAAVLGVAAMCTLRIAGPGWLARMGTDLSVLPLATQYLSIRALGMPAVLVTAACQGACLGRQDTLTPMKVCIAATLLNLFGDVALVYGAGMGVAGAAAATAAAQWIAGAVFLTGEFRKWSRLGLFKRRNQTKNQSTNSEFSANTNSTTKSTLVEYGKVGITLVARTSAGIAAYFSMAVVAARLGVLGAAAHQIAMQSFWFFSFFPEPISMAAQSLIAREQANNPAAAKTWATTLLKAGAVSGVVLAAAVAAFFVFGTGLFTTDMVVHEAVRNLAPMGVVAMSLCGVMMALDGISIGAGTYSHLPLAVATGMVATLAVLYIGSQTGSGLQGVWWALCVFYGVRVLGHAVYFGILRRGKSSVFAP